VGHDGRGRYAWDDGPWGWAADDGSASGSGEVRIIDFRFEPTVLNVTPGTTVSWTNEDGAAHTATAEDDGFDTGRLDKGESAEITFDTPGRMTTYAPSIRIWTGGS
jgi:plastocyanin